MCYNLFDEYKIRGDFLMRKTAAVSALSCCIALCVCIMCASCTHYTATVADNFSVDYSTQTEITTEQTTVSAEQAISSSRQRNLCQNVLPYLILNIQNPETAAKMWKLK